MPIVSALAAVAARGYGFLQGRFSDFELIETQTVGAGGASSVTFNSIAGTYKHLQVRGFTLSGTAINYIYVRFNSDTGTNYQRHNLEGTGTAAVSEAATNTTFLPAAYTGASSNGSVFVMDILDYASTSKNKTTRSLGGIDQNGSGYVNLFSGAWRNNTTAISSITISHGAAVNFNQHSTFSLYGVK